MPRHGPARPPAAGSRHSSTRKSCFVRGFMTPSVSARRPKAVRIRGRGRAQVTVEGQQAVGHPPRSVRNLGAPLFVELYEERRTKIPDGPWRVAYGLLAFNRNLCAAAAAADSDGFRTPR